MMRVRGLYLIRGGGATPRLASKTRADDGTAEGPTDGRLATLVVDFSRFDTWYEIDSLFEGRFMERVRPKAFKNTIARHKDRVKVFFNHGFDMLLDNKAISMPEVLEEREEFAHLEGPLFRGTPELIVEGLRAGVYGSSFMFEVVEDSWNHDPEKSEHNPDGIPERSIAKVNLFEAGPVTWPANPEATASVRSGVDWYAEQVQKRDAERYDELVRSFAAFRAFSGLRRTDEVPAPPQQKPEPETLAAGDPARHVDGISVAARRRRIHLLDMAKR